MDKTSLGDRMKGYEAVSQDILMKRTPVIIRVDGKSFHTFTKRYCKDGDPFSDSMLMSMTLAATHMTHFIQGAVLAYVQSDEISFLLRDWDSFETQQWFGGKIQKIVSVSAAMASTGFYAGIEMHHHDDPICLQHRPVFDSRVFNIPMEEVTNYFVWRQKDTIRNSVNMYAQHFFSHKQLQGKKIDDVKNMLVINDTPWETLPLINQRGFCVGKTTHISSRMGNVDVKIPIFTEDREYIEKWLDGNYDGEM